MAPKHEIFLNSAWCQHFGIGTPEQTSKVETSMFTWYETADGGSLFIAVHWFENDLKTVICFLLSGMAGGQRKLNLCESKWACYFPLYGASVSKLEISLTTTRLFWCMTCIPQKNWHAKIPWFQCCVGTMTFGDHVCPRLFQTYFVCETVFFA